MFLLDRRSFLKIMGAGVAASAMPNAALASTSADVFTADGNGAFVDSVVVMGEHSAVLIDAQFDMGNATRLADTIAATGRTLDTILITHKHPDHVLGLEAIKTRFPNARVLAHPAILSEIEKTAQAYLDAFNSAAPAGVFARKVVLPEALSADHILLEGERIDVLEPMHGDTAQITPVHIPSLDTIVASDLLYSDTHLWVAENTTPVLVDAWLASLDQLEAMGATTIIPGHRMDASVNDTSGFAKTRAYLAQWKSALDSTRDAAALKAAMLTGNENLGFALAVDRAVAAVYPNG